MPWNKDDFTRSDLYQNLNGSSLMRTVRIPPSTLVKLLGEPDESDGYKVSMEWMFESHRGDFVALYDWKSTSLYADGYPHPDTFRERSNDEEFHVGAHSQAAANDFVMWLQILEVKDAE
tara:strand:- start:224 stop:580 length:357 start_codon:yes stop_codon:yes gene_type:complete